MNHHPANLVFHTLKHVTATPLEQLEAEARKIWPQMSERGSLRVLARDDGSFHYEWGNYEISRREATLRAEGRAA